MADAATLVRPEARASTAQVDECPSSDGRIVMDADPHANAIVATRNQLQTRFEESPDVCAAGSLTVFYRQGDKEAVVAPDAFVAPGVESRERKSYKIWEEGGVVPAFLVEVASPSTSSRDGTSKRTIDERIGVREVRASRRATKRLKRSLTARKTRGIPSDQASEIGRPARHCAFVTAHASGWSIAITWSPLQFAPSENLKPIAERSGYDDLVGPETL